MRYSITIIFSWWLVFQVIAQSPQSFKYQTTVRDNSGQLMANKLVAFRIGILAGSSTANPIYAERYSIATNDFGIANLNIGQGVALQGIFSSIDWSNGPFFLKIEIDANNGTNYSFMGTSQLLSVPFALYAAKSANAADDNDKDSTNELQNLSLIGSKLQLSKANSVTLDTDTSNEIQQLNLTNNQITLSKAGGSIDLTPYKDNVDSQRLVLTGNVLQITKGNSVFLNDVDSINELQQISLAGDSLKLNNGGGYVDLAKYATDTQSLILQGNTLSISRGNTILLSGAVDLDSDPTNEIQRLKFKNDSLSLSIDTTSYRIASVENVAISKYQYATAAGNNAINLSADNTIRSYAAGMILNFKAVGTNTGSVTINLNGLGSKLLYKNVSDTLTAGDIKTNQMVSIMYDGVNFQFVNVPYSKISGITNELDSNLLNKILPAGTNLISDDLLDNTLWTPTGTIKSALSITGIARIDGQEGGAVYGDTIYFNTMYYNIKTNSIHPKVYTSFISGSSVKINQNIYYTRFDTSNTAIKIQRYNTATNQVSLMNAQLPANINFSSTARIHWFHQDSSILIFRYGASTFGNTLLVIYELNIANDTIIHKANYSFTSLGEMQFVDIGNSIFIFYTYTTSLTYPIFVKYSNGIISTLNNPFFNTNSSYTFFNKNENIILMDMSNIFKFNTTTGIWSNEIITLCFPNPPKHLYNRNGISYFSTLQPDEFTITSIDESKMCNIELHIPTVRYPIPCGVSKDLGYDSRNNIYYYCSQNLIRLTPATTKYIYSRKY